MNQRDELRRLRDRVAELEELLGMPTHPPRMFENIGEKPMRLLGLLLARRGVVTREFAFRALYGGSPECDQPARIDVINQHVARLNKHLRKRGAEIKGQYDGGYFLDEKSKRIVREILNPEMTALLSFGAGAVTVGLLSLGLGRWRSKRRRRQFDRFSAELKRMYEELVAENPPG